MSQAWKVSCPTHTLKLVLIALADNANDQRICWPSIPHLARKCDLTPKSIMEQIQKLEQEGLLGVERINGGPNRYTVLPVRNGPDPSPVVTGGTRHPGLRDPSPVVTGPVTRSDPNLKEPKGNPHPSGPGGPGQGKQAPTPPLRHLTDAFVAAYRAQFREPYLFTAKDGVAAAKLLKAGIVEDIIIQTAKRAWRHLDLFWCKQASTLHGLAGAWPKIRAELKTLDGPSAEDQLAASWGQPI